MSTGAATQPKKPSIEDFELGEPLGRGAYGDVRRIGFC